MELDRRMVLIGGPALLIGGCVTGGQHRPFQTISFESLARQIKYDIGTYLFRHQDDVPIVEAPGADASDEERATYAAAVQEGRARPPGPNQRCLGQVSFTISKVRLVATTTAESRLSGSAGLQVPIGLVTLSPSMSASSSRNQTLATTLDMYPMAGQRLDSAPPPVAEFEGTPIADTLDALARDLSRTADTPPCFEFGRETDQKANGVKWGFTVTRSQTVGGKLSLLIFSLGAEGTSTRSVANTIEVNFIGTGGFD